MNSMLPRLPLCWRKYGAKYINFHGNGLTCEVNSVKVDVIYHSLPDTYSPTTKDGIYMASFEDIGAMKLNAIVGDGTLYIRAFLALNY
jgi:hypothetical protein